MDREHIQVQAKRVGQRIEELRVESRKLSEALQSVTTELVRRQGQLEGLNEALGAFTPNEMEEAPSRPSQSVEGEASLTD